MFVPVITPLSQKLYRRKGGGGKGGGAKGGGSSSSSGSSGKGGSSSSNAGKGSGSSTSSKKGSSGSSVPVSGSVPGGKSSATAYGRGGGSVTTIPSGQVFAGRTAGGGSRDQVYGSQTYGSGYPGVAAGNRGVGGFGFPFYFWPVIWGGGLGYGGAYLYQSHEYGSSNNSSRPGGAMTEAIFVSSNSNSTFHLLSDNSTVTALIDSVQSNCSSSINSALSSNDSVAPVPYNSNSTDPSQPRPEQAIQYYRASSVVLTLDGYNDTAALGDNTNAPDVPLPSWVDNTLLNCLNQTIGAAAPLIDNAGSHWNTPSLGLLAFVILCFYSVIL